MKPYLRPYLLIQRLVTLLGCGTIAKACGKTTETVDAWGRPPASNENPSGTGKHSPLDCVVRLQRLAHKEGDAALAYEIAEMFADNANDLDGKTPHNRIARDVLIGSAIKEHGEAIVECLNAENPNFIKAHTEITQAEVALRKLKIWVKDEMVAA